MCLFDYQIYNKLTRLQTYGNLFNLTIPVFGEISQIPIYGYNVPINGYLDNTILIVVEKK